LRFYCLLLLIQICVGINLAIAEDKDQNELEASSVIVKITGEHDDFTSLMNTLVNITQLNCHSPRWKIKETLVDDSQRVKKSARAYGYYHLNIEHNVIRQNDCWLIELKFIKGPRITVKEVNLQILGNAKDDEKFMRMIQVDQIKTGDPLLHARYEQLKKRIESIAAKRGYFDGQFATKQLNIDPESNKAVIVLHYQSGIRYRIGKLQVEQDALNQDLFDKYISLIPGESFNDGLLVSTYQGLSASGYFSSVDVTPNLDQRKNGNIPIFIKATKNKPKSYTIGIGASTDIGPRIKATYSNKLVNKRGHSHRSEFSISPVISNLGFSYRVPGHKPRTDFYEFSNRATHEKTDTSTSDTVNLGAAYTNILDYDWTRIISLQYSIDDFDVGEDNDTTRLLRPALGFSKTKSNSVLRPTKGYRLNLELTGAHNALFSDIDFTQAQANAKYVRGLGNKFRLLSRVDLGYTLTNEFDELPPNLRFFAGGDTSIRGYDYESLGPEDNAGDVVGGEGLFVGSLELDYLFTPKWGGALFVDAGNAFNDGQIDLNVGAGLGLRWHSPIGPIRVDIGFPIDDPDADDSWRLHFSLGPDL
jgi:translocation and assembly module TamA